MGFNEAMKIGKCNIHGPEKRLGFSKVFHGIFMNLQLVVISCCQNICSSYKRTLQWVIYNVKGYLSPRWHPVTMIDLRSNSCMCCILETGLMRNFAADLSLQVFNNHYRSLDKVWLEILVANLASNFQDLVIKVKNLVALATVLSAVLCPVQGFHLKFRQYKLSTSPSLLRKGK